MHAGTKLHHEDLSWLNGLQMSTRKAHLQNKCFLHLSPQVLMPQNYYAQPPTQVFSRLIYISKIFVVENVFFCVFTCFFREAAWLSW
jgi:hypothetical protein